MRTDMEFKGTKGKWEVHFEKDESKITTDTHRIAQVKHYGVQIHKKLIEPTEEEGFANAKLIACAPELLEMLKTVLNNSDVPNELFDEAKELIKRATE